MFRNRIQQEKIMIDSLKNGGMALRQAMKYLYEQSGAKEMVFKYVLEHKGSKEDAEDIFQEGICAFILNIQRNKFEGKSNWKTYLMGICKNLWRTKFEILQKHRNLSPEKISTTTLAQSPETLFMEKEQENSLQKVLQLLGAKCENLLSLWLKSFSIKEIVDRTEYKNENVVSKKKHQCLKKLYNLLEQQPKLRKILIK